jgi:hypothetical protein
MAPWRHGTALLSKRHSPVLRQAQHEGKAPYNLSLLQQPLEMLANPVAGLFQMRF